MIEAIERIEEDVRIATQDYESEAELARALRGLASLKQSLAQSAQEPACKHVFEQKGDVHCRRCGERVAQQPAQEPVDMILHCPACGLQHIDAPEVQFGDADDRDTSVEWENPPHRSHLCHGCGYIWRPADVPTNGVAAIKTAGKADSPKAQQPAQAAVPEGWKLVPVEPTTQMLEAGDDYEITISIGYGDDTDEVIGNICQDDAQAIYKAMLNAAPDSP